MHNAIYGGSKIHSFKHSTCSSYFIKQIQMQRLTQEILIFEESCPATSYVAATFHPTIGSVLINISAALPSLS